MGHRINYRIYYEDTDAGDVVYYANYLKFAERARTEWLRELGYNQSNLEVLFVVRKVEAEYLHPARLDDVITVETSLQNISRASITLSQDVYREEKILARMSIVLVCVSRKEIRPAGIPEEIKTKMVNHNG